MAKGGHPDRKPWPSRLVDGHAANPSIPQKLLIKKKPIFLQRNVQNCLGYYYVNKKRKIVKILPGSLNDGLILGFHVT